jgi:hypothetical protein
MVKKKTSVKVKIPKPNMKGAKKVAISGVKNMTLTDENKHWYDLDEENVAGAIKTVVVQIENNNTDLRLEFQIFARMYGKYDNLGFGASGYDMMSADATTNIPSYNVIQSCVDTVASKIIRDNPKPVFITSGADYDTKLKAEKQTQFVQGVFQQNDFYELANNKVFRDAAVYGLGAVKWEIGQDNKLKASWIFIDELKVDRVDAMKEKPLSIHLCCMQQKELVEAQFPDKLEMIDDMSSQHPEYFRSKETVVDMLVTIESWHLSVGSGDNKKVGRHCITLQDKTLLDEEYDADYFPVIFFQYYKKPVGLYGRGVADTLFNNQIEINKILLMIQQCQELQAVPVIMVPNEAEVAEDVLLVNNIARMIPYRGQLAPTFLAPQACDPAIYDHLKWWIMSSYQEVGVSLTSATGEKQPGVNSAIAMRTMVDIESGRFVQVAKNWEKFFEENAELVMKLGKKAYQKNKDFKVTYVDKKSQILKEIPWAKINTSEDEFVIQCDTISGFVGTAAGRIQTVTDFISNGWFTPQRGMELLGMDDPDLLQEIKLQTSSLRLCEQRISSMVEDEQYFHPEPYMDLKLALRVSQMTYNQLVLDKCPEPRLQLVRQWINELLTMITGNDPTVMQLQAALAPPAPPPAVAPQAGLSPAGRQPTALPQPQ